MSESATLVAKPGSRPEIAVDPGVAAVIGDPSAPSAILPGVRAPASLPGAYGAWETVRSLYGAIRFGVSSAERARARHGDIYRGMHLGEPIVLVWQPDEVQKVVRNEGNLWSTAMGWDTMFFEGLDPERSNAGSLLSIDFDTHRAARKLLQPAFTAKAIKGYIEIASHKVAATMGAWVDCGDVEFKPEARRLLAAVASDLFTGVADTEQVATIDRALTHAWLGTQALVKNPRFSPAFRRAQRGHRLLLDFFTALVPVRREKPGADLFSHMCRDTGSERPSDHALVRTFLTILYAAYDTTSMGVTSMAYLLAKHPIWQERLREEAQSVSADPLDWAGLQKLEQLEWAWKESLRLMPVTGYLPRRSLRETEILGHRLAPGTFVGAMTGMLGRHPDWWQEPLKFDPERFSPARAEDKRHPAIYLPFGGGAHACIGAQLASIEAKLLFHALLTRCRFELAPDYEAEHTYRPLGCVSGKVALKLTKL